MRKSLYVTALVIAMARSGVVNAAGTTNLRFNVQQLAGTGFFNVSVGDSVSVSGNAVGFGGSARAAGYRWDAAGALTVLGDPIGGPVPVPDSRAHAVNSSSAAAGEFTTNGNDYKPVRWNAAGQATLLPLPSTQYTGASALAMNDAGVIVGSGENTSFGTRRAIRWDSLGNPTVLSQPPGLPFGTAYGVNNNGIAVGQVALDSSKRRAWRHLERSGSGKPSRHAPWNDRPSPGPSMSTTPANPLVMGNSPGLTMRSGGTRQETPRSLLPLDSPPTTEMRMASTMPAELSASQATGRRSGTLMDRPSDFRICSCPARRH
jgi:hypothetical protein